jgi:hypothetical protein
VVVGIQFLQPVDPGALPGVDHSDSERTKSGGNLIYGHIA